MFPIHPLSNLFRKARQRRTPRPREATNRRSAPRLAVEGLEARHLLARFVVPISVPADSTTNFHSLRAALTTPGLVAGEVIQIEPGSFPGTVANADIPAVAGLTLQGNRNVPVAEIPQITVIDAVDVQSPGVPFTFANLQVNFIGDGGFKFKADVTIEKCVFTGNGTAGERMLTLDGTTRAAIRDCTFISNVTQPSFSSPGLVFVQTAASSSNVISGNTFVSRAAGGSSLEYAGANAISDTVFGNQFIDTTLSIGDGVSGLRVADNDFKGLNTSNIVGLKLEGGSFDETVTVLRNTFSGVGQGITLQGGGVTTATVVANRIGSRWPGTPRGSWGWGIRLFPSAGGTLNATIEGNDLQDNRIGVEIAGQGMATGIDLGGGTLGSKGGNNFRSFTGQAGLVSNGGAIFVSNVAADRGPISALANLFSVADPETVIYDAGDDPTLANVQAGNALTGNAAYVQALYVTFLKRPGDTANPNDAGSWVNLLNRGGSRSVVADSIFRSAEGLGVQVASLYRSVLGREVEDSGRRAWVGYLQQGGTVEQLTNLLVTSAEYRNRYAGSDAAFVHSLYTRFLLRNPDNAGLAFWQGQVSANGRAEVARALLGSAEFRGLVVRGFYLNLLRRPAAPSQAEITGWVASGLDSVSMQLRFASTYEFARAADPSAGRVVQITADTAGHEVTRYFSPYAHGPTQKFYVFAEQRVVVVVHVNPAGADRIDTTVVAHVFDADEDLDAIQRWVNNQYSDALFADAPQPRRSITVAREQLHTRVTGPLEREPSIYFDQYDRYRVDFTIDGFTDGDLTVQPSQGSAAAFVRTKDLPR